MKIHIERGRIAFFLMIELNTKQGVLVAAYV